MQRRFPSRVKDISVAGGKNLTQDRCICQFRVTVTECMTQLTHRKGLFWPCFQSKIRQFRSFVCMQGCMVETLAGGGSLLEPGHRKRKQKENASRIIQSLLIPFLQGSIDLLLLFSISPQTYHLKNPVLISQKEDECRSWPYHNNPQMSSKSPIEFSKFRLANEPICEHTCQGDRKSATGHSWLVRH